MRIWLQSGSALTADASTPYGRLYEQALERHLQSVARGTTTLAVHGIQGTPFGKDRFDSAFHEVVTQTIQSALNAEREGYDAVAVINTFDHGYYELRELLEIPVVFITESSLYLACQLAPRFGVVCHNQSIMLKVLELARRYGLTERSAGGASLATTYADFPKMYANPAPYLAEFTRAARAVIERGADILLVAGNPLNMFLLEQGLTAVDGVPVLDCCAAAVKTAEMMVDLAQLGIRRSAHGLFGAPSPEEREALRKLYER